MVRKLQRKFILIATIATAIILTAILSMVNIYNLFRVQNQISSILDLITEYGHIPEEELWHDAERDISEGVSSSAESSSLDTGPQHGAGRRGFDLNRESIYQIRYYTARYDTAGELEALDLEHIAAIDRENALSLSATFLEMAGHDSMFFDGKTGRIEYNDYTYAYKLTPFEDGSSVLVVLDCTSDVVNVRAFGAASFWFGILCIGLFVLIVTALSRRILRPIIKNMENQKSFITNAGHELKTPVAIISANAEVMEMINGKSEWTESIMHQTKRLTELINNLITLSKMSERDESIILEDTDISVITKEHAQAFIPMIEKQGKSIDIRVDDDVHAVVEKNTYGELINILMDNASKYCDENGTVIVSCSRLSARRGARLVVSNSYKDGETVDYSRFFQRFYRQDASHNSKKGGYGIGLSMAQQIVELSKGRIKAEWNDGIISFVVTLP